MSDTVKPVLNAFVAKQNILKFNNQIKNASSKLVNVLNNFYSCISENWFSTKALEFSSFYSNLVEDLNDTVSKIIKNTDEGACNNYNYVAAKENEEQIEVSEQYNLSLNYGELKTESPSGKIGMNIAMVKAGLEELSSDATDILSLFSSISSYILLFKDSNGNRKYYFTRPEEISEVVKDIIEKIVLSVTSYINEEVDIINNAQKRAVDDLTQ